MPYFTDAQRGSLRRAWVPGLLVAAYAAYETFFVRSAGPLSHFLYFLTIAICLGADFALRGEWRKALLITASCLAAEALALGTIRGLDLGLGDSGTRSLSGISSVNILAELAMFIIRCLLAGQKRWLAQGLIVGGIFTIGTVARASFLFNMLFNLTGSGLGQFGELLFNGLDLLYALTTPALIYLALYLAENRFGEEPGAPPELRTAVMGKWPFLLLYGAFATVITMCALAAGMQLERVTTFIRQQALLEETDTPFVFILLLRMTGALVTLGIAAAYMRRVVVARMATNAISNGFIYAFAFIPVLNIIALFVLCARDTEHASADENRAFLEAQPYSAMRYIIVPLGLLAALFQFVGIVEMYRYFGRGGTPWFVLAGIALATLLHIGKIGGLIGVVYRSWAAWLIVAGNASMALLLHWPNEPHIAGLYVGVAIVSYSLIAEIYHPSLRQPGTFTEGSPETAIS